MASTYVNDLRIEEQATGENSGTWGTKVNSAFSQIAEAFSYGTKQLAADSNETFTMPDGTSDGTRSLYLKITSAGSLTATRTVTLGPNTVSKLWIIENATTGSQSITIAQGSGGTVTIPTGAVKMVYSDGAGSGAAVVDALVDLDLTGTTKIATANIDGGSIDGTTIGASTAAAGTFTTGQFDTSLNVDGTVTADGGTIVSTGSDAFSSKAVGGYAIQAYQDATSSGHTALDLRSDATAGTRYLIRGYNDAAGTPTEVFSVGADGTVTADGLTVDGSTTASVSILVENTLASGDADSDINIKTASSGGELRINFDHPSATSPSFIQGDDRLNLAPNGTVAMTLENNGDISFYEDTGTTAKFFWDASAESLGIGTSSPAQPIEILKTSAAAVVPMIQLRNGDSTAGSGTSIKFMHSTVSNATSGTCELESIRYSGNLGALTFKTSNNGGTVTERMRIDDTGVGIGRTPSSKTLEVEGTTSNYNTMLVADSASGTTGTGGGIGFQSDNGSGTSVLVAAIQGIKENSTAGDQSGALVFAVKSPSPHTVDEAVRIDSSGHVIIPAGVTLGTAAGTYNAANTLDDYEEGTFTPELRDATSGGNTATTTHKYGNYTKVGNLVTIWMHFRNIDTTGMTSGNAINITGLPFTAASNMYTSSVVATDRVTFSGNYLSFSLTENATYGPISIITSNAQDASLTVAAIDGTGSDIQGICVQYRTA